MNVDLRIERIVVEGIALRTNGGEQFAFALRSELHRSIARGGAGASLPAGGAVPYLATGTVRLGRESEPAVLGTLVGRSVYSALTQGAQR